VLIEYAAGPSPRLKTASAAGWLRPLASTNSRRRSLFVLAGFMYPLCQSYRASANMAHIVEAPAAYAAVRCRPPEQARVQGAPGRRQQVHDDSQAVVMRLAKPRPQAAQDLGLATGTSSCSWSMQPTWASARPQPAGQWPE